METESPLLTRLRELIANGGYRDGDKLPSERQLALDLGASRNALRAAFKILEAEGQIWRGVGQGTFIGVRAPRSVDELVRLSSDMDPGTVLEARMAFEAMAARYAAQRAASSDVQQLHEYIIKAERATEPSNYDLWDLRYHTAFVEAAHNPVLRLCYDVITGIWREVNWGIAAQRRNLSAERQILLARQHRMILEAIEVRDSDRAENHVIEHWQTIRSALLPDPIVKRRVVRDGVV